AAMWGRADLYGQERAVAEKTSPLVLTGSIPLPNVQGRIDHMSIDPKGRLFVSALGNNSEEVVDLSAGMRSRSIGGIPRPQGVVDATTNQRLPKEFKLGAHPESFQLESVGPNIYVNVPDLKQVAVINRNTGAISRWRIAFDSNFQLSHGPR